MVPVPHPLRFISINIAPRRKEVRVRSDRAVCLEAIFFSRGTVTKWSMPRGKRSGVVFPGEEETRGATRCFHMCDDLLRYDIMVRSVGHTQVQTLVTLLRGPGQDPQSLGVTYNNTWDTVNANNSGPLPLYPQHQCG